MNLLRMAAGFRALLLAGQRTVALRRQLSGAVGAAQ